MGRKVIRMAYQEPDNPDSTPPYFHAAIELPGIVGRIVVRLDMSYRNLMNQVAVPYRDGAKFVFAGRKVSSDDIFRIGIWCTETRWANKRDLRDLSIDKIGLVLRSEDIADHIVSAPIPQETHDLSQSTFAGDPRIVFVVHGRDLHNRDAMFEFLRSIDLAPLEWSEAVAATRKAAPYVGEILDMAFARARAVVVLLTPDDKAMLKEELHSSSDPPHETQLTGQARPNVLFEAGMAMSRDQDRTVIVEIGDLRPFSDIGGRHTLRFDGTTQRRQELAERLRSAGCAVKIDGTDWHTAGSFCRPHI